MQKRRKVNFRESKRKILKEKSKNTPLDKKIEEAIYLSELCQELKKEISKNARILPKNS